MADVPVTQLPSVPPSEEVGAERLRKKAEAIEAANPNHPAKVPKTYRDNIAGETYELAVAEAVFDPLQEPETTNEAG